MAKRDPLEIKPTTIKLIAESSNDRANLFASLIKRKTTLLLVGGIDLKIEKADYHVYFDFSGYETQREDYLKLIAASHEGGVPIFDIDRNEFLDKKNGGALMLACVTSGFLTCATELAQEVIYEHTGRLATIIEWPFFDDEFETPDTKSAKSQEELDILWFGTQAEIFSIRPYLTGPKKPYSIETININTCTPKLFDRAIDRADIIFLPKTFTSEDEETRMTKVEECVKWGKFIAAPNLDADYDGLAFNYDLDHAVAAYFETSDISRYIKEAQDILKRKYNPDVSADQLVFALKEATKDDFKKNLDYYLDQEGM